MTLLSSSNNVGIDMQFILRGRSFKYIMNNRGSRIDPWENSCFIVPQSDKMILSFIN